MGTNIVSVRQLYGTTHTLFAHMLPSQGIAVRFAESDTPDAIEKLIDDNTRGIFRESIGNPAGNICDIEVLAKVAKRRGFPLVVDNTVATPILLRPIDYGADIVVHSLTKFLGGHGTTLGSAIVDSGRFPWQAHAKRFPKFNEPDAMSRMRAASPSSCAPIRASPGSIMPALPTSPITRWRRRSMRSATVSIPCSRRNAESGANTAPVVR
jgi:O-acetylhomoserine/O-acetylserine sulfhydrylase-like pyridoxal-dependent enzyme